MKRKVLAVIIILEVLLLVGGSYSFYRWNLQSHLDRQIDLNLKPFTKADLAKFDGRDEGEPIYVAVSGLVYDVSSGSKFYAPGGSYAYLAGTNGTEALGLFSGAITDKYPVVGRLVD